MKHQFDTTGLLAEQILMLEMSDNDINNGDVIDHNDLYKEDLKLLNLPDISC